MTEAATDMRSVVVEREMPFPVEKVWRAITQPELIGEWLMPNDFRPDVGHPFQLKTSPQPGMDIVIDCKVTTVEPNRKLAYTWDYIVGNPSYDLRSVVTMTLTPTARGTQLRMEQSGFRADQKQALGGGNHAWQKYLEGLEALLARTA